MTRITPVMRRQSDPRKRKSIKISYAPRDSTNSKPPMISLDEQKLLERFESSFAHRVKAAGGDVDAREIWTIIGIIFFIIVSVNSLALVIVEYGLFKGNTEFWKGDPATACFTELDSSGFDLLETTKYYQWFDDSSVLELAQTGVYRGASGIQEYVDFISSPYFQYYKRSIPIVPTPISLTEDECVINFTTGNKAQTNEAYGVTQCVETAVSYTLYFSVSPKFHISRINLFYPSDFLATLFSDMLDTEQIRDHICNIMEFNCTSTFEFNNLNSTSCRDQYDGLNITNSLGYLDDNSKGCRVLHSAFAEHNPDHCPHLSFAPEEDVNGYEKCQVSKNTSPEDLFSEYELDKMQEIAVHKGFPADILYKTCQYDPTGSFIGEKDKKEYELSSTDNFPIADLDTQGFLCYVTFIMWATIVLTGLGTEFLFLVMVLQGKWDEDKENKWKVAQFLFPILGATTVGLANTHNYLAFPFLIVTMWKFGFPETILFLHAAIYDTGRSHMKRLVDFLNGVGTVTHHQVTALYVPAVVTGLIPSDRVAIQVTIPLLMQHWFVLVRYNNKWGYVVCQVLIEVWFEWTAFASLEIMHKNHWTGGIILASMLFAHWMYFLAGLLSLTLQYEDKEFDAEQILRSITLDATPFYMDEVNHLDKDEAGVDAFSIMSEKSVIDLGSTHEASG